MFFNWVVQPPRSSFLLPFKGSFPLNQWHYRWLVPLQNPGQKRLRRSQMFRGTDPWFQNVIYGMDMGNPQGKCGPGTVWAKKTGVGLSSKSWSKSGSWSCKVRKQSLSLHYFLNGCWVTWSIPPNFIQKSLTYMHMISQQQILSPLFDISWLPIGTIPGLNHHHLCFESHPELSWTLPSMMFPTAHQEATACHENDGHRFLADRDDGMDFVGNKMGIQKSSIKMVGREHGPNTVYTWNPNDPCFDWKRPCFGGCNHQNRGQTGSGYILEKTCWDSLKTKVLILHFQATLTKSSFLVEDSKEFPANNNRFIKWSCPLLYRIKWLSNGWGDKEFEISWCIELLGLENCFFCSIVPHKPVCFRTEVTYPWKMHWASSRKLPGYVSEEKHKKSHMGK